MIGKVIKGRYAGANVIKIPDRNGIYIQSEDGRKVAISKSNTISVDDVTAQYSSYGKKVIIVMWNNFETSIIQLGIANSAVVTTTNTQDETQSCTKHRTQNKSGKRNLKIIHVLVALFMFACISGVIYYIRMHNFEVATDSNNRNSGNSLGVVDMDTPEEITSEKSQQDNVN